MAEDGAVKKTPSGNSRVKYSDNILPMARIKKIMKMDPNITDGITVEANYLVCAAAELFIRHLAKEVHDMDKRCLTYQNLAKYVQNDEKLDFLHAVVPNKITVREYRKILAQEKVRSIDVASASDDSTSESSEDGSEEESGEEEEEESSENSPKK